MRIDAHCHVYPDKIASRAVEGIGSFYDMPLVHKGTLADLVSVQERAGVTHGVIFSVATTPHQVGSINRFIADCVAGSDGRFVGLGTVHPDSPTLRADIDEIISLGLRGVKLHPDFQRFKIDDYRCLKIYELCEGRLPVLLHCGDHRYDFSNPNRLLPVLDAFENLTVIGAHLGGWSVWEEAFEKHRIPCAALAYAPCFSNDGAYRVTNPPGLFLIACLFFPCACSLCFPFRAVRFR